MGISIWQLVIILLIVLLLFGAKRLRNGALKKQSPVADAGPSSILTKRSSISTPDCASVGRHPASG